MIIYRIINTLNNNSYVGKTQKSFKQRWSQHCRSKLKDHFHNAITKYDIKVWRFETLEVLDESESIDLLNYKEIYWIRHYNTFNNGYNSTEGGDGGATNTGKRWSLESIEKMRQSKLGKIMSEEQKQKISETKKKQKRTAPNKGVPCSEDKKLKLSQANKGKFLSNETKQKISEAMKGKPKSEQARANMKAAQQLKASAK